MLLCILITVTLPYFSPLAIYSHFESKDLELLFFHVAIENTIVCYLTFLTALYKSY